MLNKDCGFGTKAIHAGNVKDTQYGALTTPIFQTSTFVFDSCEQGGRRFAGEEAGYIYTRLSNPTTSVLEAKVAALESGEACVAAASGMGAISSALWTVAGAGKHIVADGTLYGCTFALLNHGMTRYGVEVSFVDTSDLDAVRKALKPNTCAVYLETPAKFCNEVRMFGLKDMTGAVMDPFCAFLILRGLKTLEIRMQKHCANAKAVAEFLYDHPAVEKVYYPGLIDHPGHDIARRQMRDFGGMLSFEVKGGRAAGVKLVNALHLVTVAVSLGDAETLIEHPASMTHSTYTEEELAASGIAAGLIRLSVGLENAEDLIADLKQALDTL